MASIAVFGNIGRDAETKTIGSGTQVTEWALADTVGFGQNKRTVWYRCSMFGDRGLKVAGYVRKGGKMFVSGELEPREYTGKDGVAKMSMDIVVNSLRFGGDANSGDGNGQRQQPPPLKPTPQPGAWEDDDIPF